MGSGLGGIRFEGDHVQDPVGFLFFAFRYETYSQTVLMYQMEDSTGE